MATKIFVSYRREDSAGNALGISQYLENEFGQKNVFIDVDMRAGARFPEVLEERLSACKVLLALIGAGWLDARDDQGQRRLDSPEDWVRLEVARALKRGITVIPVRVNNAPLPKKGELPEDIRGLLDYQAVSVGNSSFRSDMAGLARDIRAIPEPAQRRRIEVGVVGLLVSVLAIGAITLGVRAVGPLKLAGLHLGSSVTPTKHEASPAASNEAAPAALARRRSEFTEWTLYDVTSAGIAEFMKLSSVLQIGEKVAVQTRFPVDPSHPLAADKTFAAGDYDEDTLALDCKAPRMLIAEQTIYGAAGDVKFHWKWGDPQFLDISNSKPFPTNSVASVAQHILCDDELRTPLVSKSDLASMNFASLATTSDGQGDIFYAPVNLGAGGSYPNEKTVIVKEHEDHGLADFFKGRTVLGLPSTYRTVVERVRLDCDQTSMTTEKFEYYDDSNKLIYFIVPLSPATIHIQPNSPDDLLRNITCNSESSH